MQLLHHSGSLILSPPCEGRAATFSSSQPQKSGGDTHQYHVAHVCFHTFWLVYADNISSVSYSSSVLLPPACLALHPGQGMKLQWMEGYSQNLSPKAALPALTRPGLQFPGPPSVRWELGRLCLVPKSKGAETKPQPQLGRRPSLHLTKLRGTGPAFEPLQSHIKLQLFKVRYRGRSS